MSHMLAARDQPTPHLLAAREHSTGSHLLAARDQPSSSHLLAAREQPSSSHLLAAREQPSSSHLLAAREQPSSSTHVCIQSSFSLYFILSSAYYVFILTINVPVVYMGRDVWIWMGGNPFLVAFEHVHW
jgi:hypothetical protein